MSYEIESRSDFQAGATLVVKIPEEELDQKALKTILADKPDFILPFRHRFIDGQVEFTYQIGNRSKLAYLSGNRTPVEYAELWHLIIHPLLECDDWFMKPYSFVLRMEHLYYDKIGKTISFVYIPSVRACSDYNALKALVTDIAKQNKVTDIQLENKVVWAIQDFSPKDFLQMLQPYRTQAAMEVASGHVQEPVPAPLPLQSDARFEQPPSVQPTLEAGSERNTKSTSSDGAMQNKSDEIAINFPADEKAQHKPKSKGGLFGRNQVKEVKTSPKPKERWGFWSKKKEPAQDIIQGAAASLQVSTNSPQPVQSNASYMPVNDDYDDVTQLDMNESEGARLRYVGNGDHPKIIEVCLDEGGIFTIGRFDASIGTKQSSFEFDKKTKAVSRRHSAIERSADAYSIVDLASSAGTYLNGQKLPPNTPFKLERGDRVSFGHSGADYVWEE